MKKDQKGTQSQRSFRLAHQTLCITAFNFERESLIGYVELQVYPLRPDIRRVKINSKQCRIYQVSINEIWEADFLYNDPTMEICQGDGKQRNVDFFEACHTAATRAVDAEHGNGEITVKLPAEAHLILNELKPFRICIEFSLEQPKGGIKFVVPDLDGTMLDRGAHLFTYGHENSSRLWFPCIDCYSEVCTWKLEFTVDMYLTAVSCGDLIETVYTSDLRKKTYHYFVSTPTAAPNIALAVGPFEVFVDPNMHEVTHFCLPHLLPILKHSTAFLHEAFEFYEEMLSSRFPYSCYKQVFVDQAFDEAHAYATMTIFSTNLLHTSRVIDQTPVSRQTMADAIARQFFGCFISMNSWCDAWLPKGIAGYLSSLYRRKSFGNNEYRFCVAQDLDTVQRFEQEVGSIVLDPSSRHTATSGDGAATTGGAGSSMPFSTKQPHTISTQYAELYARKACLILRMLEIRVGRELLLQVVNKLLALATTASQQKFTSNTWSNMLLSTSSFLKCINAVTGKDITAFMEQWVHQGGCARFAGSFVFNRKRNVVELEIKQELSSKGTLKYMGPLTVAIQELDGTFNHSFKIDENTTKFEITCHSKSRRNKKRKIPLCTGEEVDMDLNDMDDDSPVLWLRIDPDLTTLRQVKLEQPDYMWQYMLRYERDVISQCQAISSLEMYPTPKSRHALTNTIENEKCFYRVRITAASCLTKVANAMVSSWAGPPAMMTIFRKMFGSHSCPVMVRQNNFTHFQHYFLQQSLPFAMANLRTAQGICPAEVFQFLLDLFKYNDNSKNKYSDSYYRAILIDALAATVTPAVTTVTVTGQVPSTDALTADTKLILEEITRYMNLEKLLPCYRLQVTVSCLKAIRKLQKFGHLPSDPSIFKSYAVPDNFIDVRLAAINALVDYVNVESSSEILSWLLDVTEEDPEVFVRHKTLQYLAETPPFKQKENHPLSTEVLVERLWKMMNCSFSHDSRLRCDVAHLYYTLYGRTRPSCLPIPESVIVLNLKEKRTMLNPSMISAAGSDQENAVGSDVDMSMDFPEKGVKRKAESPFSAANGLDLVSAADPSVVVETSISDPCKRRITTMASIDSPSEEMIAPTSVSASAPSIVPFSGPIKEESFSQQFANFAMGPEHSQTSIGTTTVNVPNAGGGVTDMTVSHHPPSPLESSSMAPIGASIVKTEDDLMARLSEDSSNSLPPIVLETEESGTKPPTAFDLSMFTSSATVAGGSGETSSSPAPPTGLAENENGAAGGGSGTQHKHHKSKKKKKKNKHKHKHRHRHEKHEKSEKSSKSKSSGLAVLTAATPGVDLQSSEPSNPNSPSVDVVQSQPSSPEFEVL